MTKKLIEVDARAFDDLMYWLERCESKGHLERCPDLIEPWEAFDKASWREVPEVVVEPVDLKRIVVIIEGADAADMTIAEAIAAAGYRRIASEAK